MSKSFLDKILGNIFDAEWKGRHGEKLTERELKLVRFFGRDGKILRNVYIPKPNGETSEIDVLFITQKGIFVIESKNYSGWIFGNEEDRMWTVCFKGGCKERFYNPIKQNRGHVKCLNEYLEGACPLFSIVAFSERCELKDITVVSDVRVVKRDRLYATIREIWDSAEDALSKGEVGELYRELKLLTQVSEDVKENHVERLKRFNYSKKNRRKPQESNSEDSLVENSDISSVTLGATDEVVEPTGGAATETEESACDAPSTSSTASAKTEENPFKQERACPKCGSRLTLRLAKRGKHAGEIFWGCEKFPKCRYVESIKTP